MLGGAWTQLMSEEHGQHYYFDSSTGESSWMLPAGAIISELLPRPLEKELQGWSDCTSEASVLFSGSALRHAWRRSSVRNHPDKGGSSESFQAATEAKEYLKHPLRYLAFHTLHNERLKMLAFDERDEKSMVQTARVTVGEDADNWPRLTFEASFEAPTGFGRHHVWRIALAHENASTIEYKGDESSGGYDVCCNFLRNSRCELRPRDEVLALLNRTDATVDVSGEQRQRTWHEERDAHLLRHDCPLPQGEGAVLNTSVSKPLHLKAAGRWSAVLLAADAAALVQAAIEQPPPVLCISALFTVAFSPRPPREPPPYAANTTARFEQMSSGRWCRDGAEYAMLHAIAVLSRARLPLHLILMLMRRCCRELLPPLTVVLRRVRVAVCSRVHSTRTPTATLRRDYANSPASAEHAAQSAAHVGSTRLTAQAIASSRAGAMT